MLHNFIFVHRKPGMGQEEFFRYWKKVHAIKYGMKIRQAKAYLIDTRIPFGPEPEDPLFDGVAEVWIESDEELMAFIQSKEYIEGSRIDEPNFIAFWRMFTLSTTDHIFLEKSPKQDFRLVKLLIILKRRGGMSLEDFRRHSLEVHAPKVLKIPGLRRYTQCHARNAHYAIGESILDSVSLLWFDNTQAIEEMMESPEYKEQVQPDFANFAEPRYIHTLVTDEYWVIGPELR